MGACLINDKFQGCRKGATAAWSRWSAPLTVSLEIHIPAHQHVVDPFAPLFGESARFDIFMRVTPCAEQQVPKRQTIIVCMVVELVMDAMHLRALDKITHPQGGGGIGVDIQIKNANEKKRPCSRCGTQP